MLLKNFIQSSQRGTAALIAEKLGIEPSYLSQLASGTATITPQRAVDIEFATSGEVTCEELRPDVTWFRVKDRAWPHPKGRPLVDHAKSAERKAA